MGAINYHLLTVHLSMVNNINFGLYNFFYIKLTAIIEIAFLRLRQK